jgi:Flp pilus assembly protein TadD
MQVLHEDKDRKVIPRWRSFRRELITGELKPLTPLEKPIKLPLEFLDEKFNSWKENKTVTHATDLVSSAIVLGRESEVADIAKFILSKPQKGNEVAHIIAKHALGIETKHDDIDHCTEILDVEKGRQAIRDLKIQLQDEPKNIFIWNDIALLYESLGFQKQSEKAISVALQISPKNRYILRSAARLHIHHENGRRAHELLRRNESTPYDPWLLSAEIAVASVIRRTSRFVKTARLMLESNNFQPFHTSELASAVATLEFEAGNIKKARKLFEQSLRIPTENAVAQVFWALRMDRTLGVQPNSLKQGPISHEALAWQYNQNAKWDDTVTEAYKWLMDQPFSSRPAILGSYVLAVIKQDYRKSLEMTCRGLIANPDDFTLINNYAYAATLANDLKNAKNKFSKIDQATLDKRNKIVWLATSGLINYREELPEQGRQLYLQSMELAKAEGEAKLACMALANFAAEEIRINSNESEQIRKQALDTIEQSPFADLKPLLNRLKK